MNKYFAVTDGDVRLVEWGDPEDSENSMPIIICPPIIPAEVIDALCATLVERDPEGKYGIAMEEYAAAEMNEAIQDIPPEEDITQVWEEDAP